MLNVQYIDIEPAYIPKPGVGPDPDPENPALWDANPLYVATKRSLFDMPPTNPTKVAVDPDGGPAQDLGVDFEALDVSGFWYLSWDLPSSAIDSVSQFYPVRLRVAYEV